VIQGPRFSSTQALAGGDNSAKLMMRGEVTEQWLPRRGTTEGGRNSVTAAGVPGPKTPGMEANGRFLHGELGAQRAIAAGDPRANENTLLTGVHTLFARHHNLLVQNMQAGRHCHTTSLFSLT
jgi:hypothetical protein